MRRKIPLSTVSPGGCFVVNDGRADDRSDRVGSILNPALAYRVDRVDGDLAHVTNALDESDTLSLEIGVHPIPRGGYDRLVANHIKALKEAEEER
jgi:hypothetical protein